MSKSQAAVLPYRMDAGDLTRWIEARARGRSPSQIRTLGFSAKTFEGTLTGAQALGLVRDQSGDLTAQGERYALADEQERRVLLKDAMMGFEPYGLLIEAISDRSGPPQETEVSWIEAWWATNGYGTSQTNRAEGTTAFARLVDWIGLGTYIQGRRGHPSRIQWNREIAAGRISSSEGAGPALARKREAAVVIPPPLDAPEAPIEAFPDQAGTAPTAEVPGGENMPAPGASYNNVMLEFGAGRLATLRVPTVLSASEKQRLLALLDLLIAVIPGE